MTEDQWYNEYKRLEAENERLKALLVRAADALETYPVGSGWNLVLIAELRKAAE